MGNQYNPEPGSVTPPGATIKETMEEHNWSVQFLAEQMGVTEKILEKLIRGEIMLDDHIALRLERATMIPRGFWLTRERHFRRNGL